MLELKIIGNIGRDAELRSMDNGRKVISFNVAHSENFTNREGVKEQRTTWVSCSIWRNSDQSTKIVDYLKKGQQVYLSGKPDANSWTDQNNQVRAGLRLQVVNVELLGSNPNENRQQSQQQQQQQQAQKPAQQQQHNNNNFEPPASDDLPF